VPGFDAIEPLAPDACHSDPSAPCHYLHLKRRARNGDAGKLSELAFVGIFPPRPRDGWYQPGEIAIQASANEQDEPPAAYVAIMQKLMMLGGRERLEFLG
jgi:hypothetical protein